MESFLIKGGNRLSGTLEIDSAKNAILPIISATILTDEEVVLENVPKISDVDKMLEILKSMGASVESNGGSVIIRTLGLNNLEIPSNLTKDIRSSIFILGPLLAKYKRARVAYPGGCDIGSRPIDLHLSGFKDLGVEIVENHGFIDCDARNMKSGVVHLDFPSVGATENIMMCAVLLKGETTILNSAKEPEIVDLARFINKMGGNIRGAGTSSIVITGVERLKGATFRSISDRIIAGTYLIACAMTGGKITLNNANYEDNYALVNKLRNAGATIDYSKGSITIESRRRPLACASIETQPYPGFPTDLQAQILALQTISDGISVITENMFETRFKHVPELLKMGAKVTTKDRMAIVRGVSCLHGAEVVAHDLRGGAGLILAGLVAEGETRVLNAHYIDRGYQEIENQLQSLNAQIVRQKNV